MSEPLAVAAFEAVAEPEPVAAAPAPAPVKADPRKPQVAALERVLTQVQTRRLVLVAESVA